MRHALVVALGLLGLSACNTVQPGRGELFMSKAEVEAKDDSLCQSYGAKPGTDIYIQCRMQADTRRQAFRAQVMSDTTCTSNKVGGTVLTNCY